ncbi:MAG: exodeoxyribonuclease III [Bdellovibrionales bacterium]
MRIATWNVNSIRTRMPNVLAWLETAKPDVLLMQEIKCETDAFPAMEFNAAGYNIHAFGQKAYNGVAIASLHKIDDVQENFPDSEKNEQARYLEATIKNVHFASIYVPNGNPLGSDKFSYKLDWLAQFRRRAERLLHDEKLVVFGGDFNVIFAELDVYDPKGWEEDALYCPQTRAAFRDILSLGYTEVFRAQHPDQRAYSFWDYQGGAWQQDKGLRLDHFIMSPEVVDRVRECYIDRAERGKDKASDHVPVVVDI